MPSYNVTGKLGGGKTLWCVKKAMEALQNGLTVASNIDLFPENLLSLYKDQKSVRLLRLPDHPTREHLDQLGKGNESNDETKNGLLILDECGTMLNARNYQASGRQELISWFLHARKLGWDLMFISQSHTMIDKQIRDALIEYLVVCKRFDRYKIPLLGYLGIKINMPRIHFAIVKYGNTPQAMVSERDFFRGSNLFNAYSTRQVIEGSIEGVSSVLSPWHLKGRHMSPKKLAFYASKAAFLGGIAAGVLGAFVYFRFVETKLQPEPVLSAVTNRVTGAVMHPDGSVTVIKPDGISENTRQLTYTQDGTVAHLSTGKYLIAKN